jgi:hypothetical protein
LAAAIGSPSGTIGVRTPGIVPAAAAALAASASPHAGALPRHTPLDRWPDHLVRATVAQ